MEVRYSDNIILVGTAHVSPKSVAEVTTVIEREAPDFVAVELDERRKEVLMDRSKWEQVPVAQLIKGRNAYFFLAQAYLAAFQRRLGEEYGAEPGSEMVAAIETAGKVDADVVLADRDISITMQKAWRKMRFREKMRLLWEMMKLIVPPAEGEEDQEMDLDELMEQDMISMMMEELGSVAPTVAQVLIAERDTYLARHIFEKAKEGKVVAVVGAGHLQGIQKDLKRLERKKRVATLVELEQVPPRGFPWGKAIGFSIPVVILTAVVYRFYISITAGEFESALADAQEAFFWWIVINAVLTAAFAAIARPHPLSLVMGGLASPVTSLIPTVAAGWVAGGTELWVRKPTNQDFLELFKLTSTEDFFRNIVIKVLMVAALANVGSTIATIIALPYLLRFGLG